MARFVRVETTDGVQSINLDQVCRVKKDTDGLRLSFPPGDSVLIPAGAANAELLSELKLDDTKFEPGSLRD